MARATDAGMSIIDQQQTARQMLATAINVPLEKIDEHTKIGSLPEWDSIGHLRLVLELERLLKRQLSADEIIALTSLQDVEKVLASVAVE